ncbi:MAG: hypothetical protein ABIE42_00425 [Candidatus Eisenbacteria bacterium]
MLTGSLILMALACTACGDTSVVAPVAPAEAASRADLPGEFEVLIQISPATLVLDSPGTWVTVHAEIAYRDVDSATLTMNGVVPTYSKSDDCGDLVVKFEREDIQNIVSPPEATLILTGLTVSGESFTGSETITVQ